MQTVVFHRHFERFQGGHLKVFHYFEHVRSSPSYRALIRFTGDSVWGPENPWWPFPDAVLPPDDDTVGDIRFLAGMDWRAVPPEQRDPPTGAGHQPDPGLPPHAPPEPGLRVPAPPRDPPVREPRARAGRCGTRRRRGPGDHDPDRARPRALPRTAPARCSASSTSWCSPSRRPAWVRPWRSGCAGAVTRLVLVDRLVPQGAADRGAGRGARQRPPAGADRGRLPAGAREHGAGHARGVPRLPRQPLLLPRRGDVPGARPHRDGARCRRPASCSRPARASPGCCWRAGAPRLQRHALGEERRAFLAILDRVGELWLA